MPETTDLYLNSELNINDLKNDCEKVRFLADEYLHDELSEENKDFIDKHITECNDCFDFIEEEKKYLEEIKLSEYIPEISISKSVMDKIIENKMIIDKPPRKRFVPVGFITAAAVVIIIFAASRGGPLNMLMKSSQDNSANELGIGHGANNEIAMYDSAIIAETEAEADIGNMKDFARGLMIPEPDEDYVEPEIVPAPAVADAPVDAPYDIIAEEEVPLLAAAPAPTETPEENLTAPEILIPPTVEESQYESMDEYISINSGLEINEIYVIYFLNQVDIKERRTDIIKDIEICKTDDMYGMFDIIDKKYNNILQNNLIYNSINIGEILSKYQDGKYIAVIYWFN